MSRRAARASPQPAARLFRLGDIGLAGERGDQHRVGAGHADVGGEIAEASGIDQHEISGTALCVIQVGKAGFIRLSVRSEARSFVGRPIAERLGRVGVECRDPQPIRRQPAGEQHGNYGLAGSAFAAGENGHDVLCVMTPLRMADTAHCVKLSPRPDLPNWAATAAFSAR
jgi:hypothetical protein